jgi:hypothetical protein
MAQVRADLYIVSRSWPALLPQPLMKSYVYKLPVLDLKSKSHKPDQSCCLFVFVACLNMTNRRLWHPRQGSGPSNVPAALLL